MKAPLPENEPERLATLRGLGILDTPPELAYDELSAPSRPTSVRLPSH